ncbi:hypothetical protein ASAP_2472 [Asaia bogorensis]|uniref:Doubled CXXCH motif domain-containing protein n=1 Tax=Asaia bogorensis TaxID=91915 RepID=A0A060QLP6_9PROT|nr:hypothetical protein ASAP_2472 [Asaia bogorensis]
MCLRHRHPFRSSRHDHPVMTAPPCRACHDPHGMAILHDSAGRPACQQ